MGELCGIVWHSGITANSGHYYSNVQINGRWFLTNDTEVIPGLKQYDPNSLSKEAPYILVYKKQNNIVVPVSQTSATTSYTISSTANPDSEHDLIPAKKRKPESCIDFEIDFKIDRKESN